MDQNVALQDALARAKQIAAKLQSGQGGPEAPAPAQPDPVENTRKRAVEDSGLENGEPVSKKASNEGSDPKAIAMQVAASIAQRAGLGSMVVEDIKVPNRYVGLIIGRGGEMINKLQSETGARIQVAPDPPAGSLQQDRSVTVTGTPQAVENAKKLINKISDEGKVPDHLQVAAPQQPGEFVLEYMIPSKKVGLVIGKGGETIKSLQERAGCRMVMIQDGQFQNAAEKPLRISGDPQKCQYGKQLVIDLLTEKELEQVKPPVDYRGQRQQEFGIGGKGNIFEMPVPRDCVGFVIGKNGETIKKIQGESGCRVQFKIPDLGNTPERVCILQGEPPQIQRAQQLIGEIIESSRQRQGRGMPRGPPPGTPGVRTVEMSVSANKCGLVIGKGGETIRNINQITGAHVEINRQIPDNAPVKSFIIRGTDPQIQHAQNMIREKTGEQGTTTEQTQGNYSGQPSMNQPPSGGPQSAPAPMQPPQQQPWGFPGYNSGYGQQQQYGQAPQQQYQPPTGNPQPPSWPQPYQQAFSQPAASVGTPQQPAASAAAPVAQAPAAAQPQTPQDVQAAWAAYYQQYYQQYGMQVPAAVTATPSPAVSSAATQAAPAAQSATSQPDYSAHWAAYYQHYYPQYAQAQPGQTAQPGQPRS